jgi:hypothetical protein
MFQYEKLGHREIRLLSLQLGRWDDEVRFDLVHVLLVPEKLPFYEAVSYTWGPQGDLRPVLCQGTRVDVSRNAFSVLRRFRFRDRIRWVSMHIIPVTLFIYLADSMNWTGCFG